MVVADTNAIGPSAHVPHGPAQRGGGDDRDEQPDRRDDRDHRRPGSATTAAGWPGTSRPARDAAATDEHPHPRQRRDPGALGPQPALVDEQHEQVDDELPVGEHGEERLDEVVHVVAGLVVVGEVGEPGLGPALASCRARGRWSAARRATASGTGRPTTESTVAVTSGAWARPFCLVELRHQHAGAEVRAARDDEPQPLAAAGIRERGHDEVGAVRARPR